MEIKVGQWIMKEGMLLGRFSKPFLVKEVKGQRVYFEKPIRNRAGEIEWMEPGYCLKKSVRYVVDTEAAGVAFWESVYNLRDAEMIEIRAVNTKFTGLISEAASAVPGLQAYKG